MGGRSDALATGILCAQNTASRDILHIRDAVGCLCGIDGLAIDVDGTHVAAVKVGHIIEPKQPMVDSEA